MLIVPRRIDWLTAKSGSLQGATTPRTINRVVFNEGYQNTNHEGGDILTLLAGWPVVGMCLQKKYYVGARTAEKKANWVDLRSTIIYFK